MMIVIYMEIKISLNILRTISLPFLAAVPALDRRDVDEWREEETFSHGNVFVFLSDFGVFPPFSCLLSLMQLEFK